VCEICLWQTGREDGNVNWPWTERKELEEWTPEDGYEDGKVEVN